MRVLEIQRGAERQKIATFLTAEETSRLAGIPPQAVIGVLAADGTLQVNATFREFLHEVIASAAPGDPALIDAARSHGDGRLVYIDDRLPPATDPVPDEDILGWFQVRDGAIVTNSYQPNPAHRIEGTHGFTAAIAALRPALVAELLARETPA